MKRFVHVLLIIVMFVTFPLISSLLFSIHPVSANPGGFDSHPTAHVATGGLAPGMDDPISTPSRAYDEDNGTSAYFHFGVKDGGGSFNLTTFEKPVIDYPIVGNPQFKMRYSTVVYKGSPNEFYRILYYVSPSSTPTVLLGWVAATVSEDTYVWSGSAEPNDGNWSWTDVENIRFVVEVSVVAGGRDNSDFDLFEAWVTVPVGSPPPSEVSVDPANITNYGKTPGSTFFVDINISNVVDMWGYEFILSFDTFILTPTSYSSYAPFNIPWPSEMNDTLGFVSIAYSMPFGVTVGFTGHTNMARITFSVDALGESNLTVHDSKISDIYGGQLTHSENDGYFRNVDSGLIPSAVFGYTPTNPIEREDITFNASDSTPNGGAIVNYTYVFGDYTNVTETDPIATHNYTSRGTYTVTLAVFDDEDIVGTVQHDVTVLAHDVAIILIGPNTTEAAAGEDVQVTVKVKNEGDFTETFDVTAYRNETAIGTQTPTLAAGVSTDLQFIWDTTGNAPGNYIISANATVVANEYDTADNTFVDDVVLVTVAVPEFPLGAAIEIGLVIAIIYFWWSRRSKTKTIKADGLSRVARAGK